MTISYFTGEAIDESHRAYVVNVDNIGTRLLEAITDSPRLREDSMSTDEVLAIASVLSTMDERCLTVEDVFQAEEAHDMLAYGPFSNSELGSPDVIGLEFSDDTSDVFYARDAIGVESSDYVGKVFLAKVEPDTFWVVISS